MARQKIIPKDQFQNMKMWLEYHKEHKKLPYGEITCCKCKSFPAKLKGAGMKHALKNAGGDIEVMLKSTMCKECRLISLPQKEKKSAVKRIKTQWEIEEEIEEIRRNTPKIDLNKPNTSIYLKDNKEACEKHTTSCLRPDIYLNNDRTCDTCSIKKYCVCHLKRFKGEPRKK